MIRTVTVLYAAFHPQISKCFNMTVLSLFTMWETRRNCTLRQRSEHEVIPLLTAFAHTHTHTLFFFLPAAFLVLPCVQSAQHCPQAKARGALWGSAMWVLQEMLLPERERVKTSSLQEK